MQDPGGNLSKQDLKHYCTLKKSPGLRNVLRTPLKFHQTVIADKRGLIKWFLITAVAYPEPQDRGYHQWNAGQGSDSLFIFFVFAVST